jgi:hypothetical protein
MSLSAGPPRHVLLLIMIWLSWGCASWRGDRRFIVEGGALRGEKSHVEVISGRWKLPNGEFIVYGHRIESGAGTVIGVRAFENPLLPLSPDQGGYTKVTVYLPPGAWSREGLVLLEKRLARTRSYPRAPLHSPISLHAWDMRSRDGSKPSGRAGARLASQWIFRSFAFMPVAAKSAAHSTIGSRQPSRARPWTT